MVGTVSWKSIISPSIALLLAQEDAFVYRIPHAVGQPLHPGAQLRVAADELPGPRAALCERLLDRSRYGLHRRAFGPALAREPPERRDALAVQRTELRRRSARERLGQRGRLRPDRRLDRARLDERDLDAEGPQLDAQRVGDRLQGVFRSCVRAEERQRTLARDRADEDDSPAGPAKVREECLRDRDLSDHVDLEL